MNKFRFLCTLVLLVFGVASAAKTAATSTLVKEAGDNFVEPLAKVGGVDGVLDDFVVGADGTGMGSMTETVITASKGYSMTSAAVKSALASRIGKKGYTQVGYQFQKHFGRGGAWGNAIPQGAKLNPTTFNEAGYKTFQEIWRDPGSFQKVGGFLEKRLPDGRGIRLQENWIFKGFLD